MTTRPALLFILLLAVFVVVWVGTAPQVLANGGTDTRTILEERAGGYDVVVTSTPGRPTAGLVHFTFSVLDAETGVVVSDAVLQLATIPPPESEVMEGTFPISRSDLNPDLYDVDVRLEAEGVWSMALSIDGPNGAAEADFLLEVRGPASRIFAILIVVLAFPVLLVLLEIWRRWDRRKRRARQIEGSDVLDSASSGEETTC